MNENLNIMQFVCGHRIFKHLQQNERQQPVVGSLTVLPFYLITSETN